MVALLMALDGAQHLCDRFEDARRAVRDMWPHGLAPGRSYQGFIKALAVFHERLFAGVCLMLQAAVQEVAGPWCNCGRWRAFAVDGSRVECPMTADNEREFGCAGKAKTTPQQYLTMLLHLGTGLPWAFRRAGARGSERDHLLEMLPQLPPHSMLVADAGFTGYELLTSLQQAGHAFLVRVGSNVRLLRKLGYDVQESESTVYLWPQDQRQQPPLTLRLIRLADGRNRPMCLLSNVRGEQELSEQEAVDLYRRRWGIELCYRALKQTLARRKMRSGAPQNAEMELDWAVAGLWLLGLMSLKEIIAAGKSPQAWSVAASLRIVRRAMSEPPSRGRRRPLERQLAGALRDGYVRRASKAARRYPRKKTETPPGEPILREATATQIQQAAELRPRREAA
jgi:hypothetical protein